MRKLNIARGAQRIDLHIIEREKATELTAKLKKSFFSNLREFLFVYLVFFV